MTPFLPHLFFPRLSGVFILSEIGPDAKDAVPTIIAALSDENWNVRIMAIIALGKIGPAAEPAIPALNAIAQEAGMWYPGHLKISAKQSLAQINPQAAPIPPSEYELFYQGGKLTAEQAAELENKLKQNPKDLDSQLELIGYDMAVAVKAGIASPAGKAARQKSDDLIAGLSQQHSVKQSETIAVRRDLLFSELLFQQGDLDVAQDDLEASLRRYEQLLKTHADLANDTQTLEEGLWAILVWRKIYHLKNQVDPKDFPLKSLWDKEAGRLPKLLPDFKRLYGPS